MKQEKNQEEILVDTAKNGKDRNWRGRKILSLKLADVFEYLDYPEKFVSNIRTCGNYLNFIKQPDGSLKLYQAYFCKNKLCALCNWRRSMKYSWQTARIVDEAIQQEPKGRFLFLTLTVKNVPGQELNQTVSSLTKSFDRLFKRAKVKKNMIGYLRSVEITHNDKEDTYHPHIHVLMMVRPSYFRSSDDYITQAEWGDMWAQSLKVDYTPMVDIRAVREQGKGLRGAILETAKYPTKPIELDLSKAHVVDDLYQGLYRRRQLGYGGLFKEIKKQLALDDVENGNLVQTSDDKTDVSTGLKIVVYWNASKQEYLIKDIVKKK